ncbi:hypothetical protein [Paraflavitalea speifideaquila]|uniref:hypothetical protein n=1 Tax=Paraflavitalea speifideaquila TaxID=3076558 RepID=UPI0028EE4858|nr:hypothetical protein [Paraflavitalea speifideiaquila]
MKTQIYQVVSYLTVIMCCVPVVIVLLKKLWRVSPFQYYAIYWVINGLVNSMLLIEWFPRKLIEVVSVIYNLLDFPMMVGIIYLSAFSPKFKRSFV